MNVIEEIRQEKIKSIENLALKRKQFEDSYKSIYQAKYIKLSKNISFNFVRFFLLAGVVLLIILSVCCFNSEWMISNMEATGETFTSQEREESLLMFQFLGFFFLIAALFFLFISYLAKANNKKRTLIYEQSKLLEDILEYLDNDIADQKKRYEVFVDEHNTSIY